MGERSVLERSAVFGDRQSDKAGGARARSSGIPEPAHLSAAMTPRDLRNVDTKIDGEESMQVLPEAGDVGAARWRWIPASVYRP